MDNVELNTASNRPILCYLATGLLSLFGCGVWLFGSYLDGPDTATHVVAPFIFLVVGIGALRASWREGRNCIWPVSIIVAGIALANILAIVKFGGFFAWSETFSILWFGPTLASLVGALVGMGASRRLGWIVRR